MLEMAKEFDKRLKYVGNDLYMWKWLKYLSNDIKYVPSMCGKRNNYLRNGFTMLKII